MAFSNINWGDVLTRAGKTALVTLTGSVSLTQVADRDYGAITVALLTATITGLNVVLNVAIQAKGSSLVNTGVNDPDQSEGA